MRIVWKYLEARRLTPLEGHKRRHILRGEPVKLEIRK